MTTVRIIIERAWSHIRLHGNCSHVPSVLRTVISNFGISHVFDTDSDMSSVLVIDTPDVHCTSDTRLSPQECGNDIGLDTSSVTFTMTDRVDELDTADIGESALVNS